MGHQPGDWTRRAVGREIPLEEEVCAKDREAARQVVSEATDKRAKKTCLGAQATLREAILELGIICIEKSFILQPV